MKSGSVADGGSRGPLLSDSTMGTGRGENGGERESQRIQGYQDKVLNIICVTVCQNGGTVECLCVMVCQNGGTVE